MSINEVDVKNKLDELSIKYIKEKTFPNLKDKAKLRFDFYLIDYNILIECQGLQHFEHFHKNYIPRDHVETVYKHDYMKYNYCKENNLKLLYYTNAKNKKYIPKNYFDKVYIDVEELIKRVEVDHEH